MKKLWYSPVSSPFLIGCSENVPTFIVTGRFRYDCNIISIDYSTTRQLKIQKVRLSKKFISWPSPFTLCSLENDRAGFRKDLHVYKVFPWNRFKKIFEKGRWRESFFYQKNTVVISMFYWRNQTTAMWEREYAKSISIQPRLNQ